MEGEFEDLCDFLRRYKDQEVIYIPNPGNAGDSIIAYGTLLVFRDAGLRWTFGDINETYAGKTLFYAGGGNLGLYTNCITFLERNKDLNHIVVLPHTIIDADDVLRGLGDNITIICRERTSFEYVKSIKPRHVYLSKDFAFYIRDLDAYHNPSATSVLNSFRTDNEKTTIPIPEDNLDISYLISLKDAKNNTCNVDSIVKITDCMFGCISKFGTVNTNRLHVAIAASLLGKRVHFYPNCYHKNRSVYEYSMRDRFPNTVFHDDENV